MSETVKEDTPPSVGEPLKEKDSPEKKKISPPTKASRKRKYPKNYVFPREKGETESKDKNS